jgi:hypothetical protein
MKRAVKQLCCENFDSICDKISVKKMSKLVLASSVFSSELTIDPLEIVIFSVTFCTM